MPTVALPLVYSFLSSKESAQYGAALQAVRSFAATFGIANCKPQRIMTDFELAILNACSDTFVDEEVVLSCCFFHLSQNIYRHVQSEGLQQAYNAEDDTVRTQIHMLAALAFVPVDHVLATFAIYKAQIPPVIEPVVKYFDETYVSGRRAQGRRRAVLPRYAIPIWNQYQSTVDGEARTNNVSEGWHNRFRLLVAKHHPDIFSACRELQKEQGATEISIVELGLGKKN